MHGRPFHHSSPITSSSSSSSSFSLFSTLVFCLAIRMIMVSECRMPPARLTFPPVSPNIEGTPGSPPFTVVSPHGSSSSSSPTVARARQSRILDRWAVQQAQGIITTIERKAHEAELSALTTNVRASSLIQMWKGMEAESGGGGTPTTARSSSGDAAWDSYVGERSTETRKKKPVVVKCDMKEVMEREERQREEELKILAGVCAVSRFPHRKRIQTFLRIKSLRRDSVGEDQRGSIRTNQELDQLQRGVAIVTLRQMFGPGNRQPEETVNNSTGVEKNDISFQREYYSNNTNYTLDSEQSSSTAEREESHVPPREEHPPHSESEEEAQHEDPSPHPAGGCSYDDDLHQEGSQNSDIVACSWEEEESLEMSNIDWERSLESTNHDDDIDNGEEDRMHILQASNSLDIRRQTTYNELLETHSHNPELRQLLERRTVSTYLSGDFRETLDRVLASALQRQGSNDDTGSSESEYEMFQNHNLYSDGIDRDHQPLLSSSSPVPARSSFQSNDNSAYASYDLHQRDLVVHELRDDIARMNREMHELRQLLRRCMENQGKFQDSVKQDVADTRSDYCITCDEKKIDSMICRRGHMCACFRCPVCQAPIVDVIRAHPIHEEA